MPRTEWIPSEMPESKRLMMVLHGLGDSLNGYRWLPRALQIKKFNYLLVNAPDPYYGGYSWYDYDGDPAPGIARSRDLLFELIEQSVKAGFPTAEMTLLGFSQGCLMTMEVGLRHPSLFAAFVGISGYLHEPEKLELSPVARRQHFLMTHGTADPLIPIAAVREQAQLLKSAGIDLSWRELEKEHTIAGMEEVGLIRAFLEKCYGDS